MAKETGINKDVSQGRNIGKIISIIGQFLEKCFKQIFVGIAVIIVIVVGIVVFYQSYLVPHEKNAEIALSHGQTYFSNQQWEIALNGDGADYIGFLGIIEEFGGTKSANLAKAYAGICQYKLGDYREALKTLKNYHGKDRLFAAQIMGAIGDCEVNLGNIKEGITYFQKAVTRANSSLLSPIYLKKAAVAYESLEDYKSALEIYTIIKTKYPKSLEATTSEKYIERAK